MKLLPLASLTLIASLSLTGCSTSPSIESQTKLIEYERCLEFENGNLDRYFELLLSYPENIQKAYNRESLKEVLKKPQFEIVLKNCAQYRP